MVMTGACNYCGNARPECTCPEYAEAIVAGIVHGEPSERGEWFKRFMQLRPRFEDGYWGELFEREIAKGIRPRAAAKRLRYRYSDEHELRLPSRWRWR